MTFTSRDPGCSRPGANSHSTRQDHSEDHTNYYHCASEKSHRLTVRCVDYGYLMDLLFRKAQHTDFFTKIKPLKPDVKDGDGTISTNELYV